MIRPKARIWYSRGLSNVYDALRILRESFHALRAHVNP